MNLNFWRVVCSDSCPSGQKLCSHTPTNFLVKGKISSCDSLLSTPLQKLAIYHKNPTFKDIMLVCCWKDSTLVVHIDTSSSHSSPIKFIIISNLQLQLVFLLALFHFWLSTSVSRWWWWWWWRWWRRRWWGTAFTWINNYCIVYIYSLLLPCLRLKVNIFICFLFVWSRLLSCNKIASLSPTSLLFVSYNRVSGTLGYYIRLTK